VLEYCFSDLLKIVRKYRNIYKISFNFFDYVERSAELATVSYLTFYRLG